jgi:4-hydroxybenzoate polyprenyltransferase
LIFFLGVGFFGGMVIEIGRKIRAPNDEERGVETYSALWGRKSAVTAWLAACALTAAATLLAASRVDGTAPLAGLLGMVLCGEIIAARRFLRHPTTNGARLIEQMAALATLCIYLGLGALPLLFQA